MPQVGQVCCKLVMWAASGSGGSVGPVGCKRVKWVRCVSSGASEVSRAINP